MINDEITTIIPTFRRPKLLRRAIESALAQTYRNIKICVYDNASEDTTEDVVKDYTKKDSRVFYFKNRTNLGSVNNMIKGVNNVETSCYSILNDDDFLLPEFYENALMKLSKYPDAGFVCAKTVTVDVENGKCQFRNKDWMGGYYVPSVEIINKMNRSHFTQTGVLLKNYMRKKIGPYEKSGDDMLYLSIAAAASPFIVLDEYGAVYTQHKRAFSWQVGLRKKDMLSVYEALLSTIETISNIEANSELKAYILMLVVNSYGSSFDSKKLNILLNSDSENNLNMIKLLPSRVTKSGLISKCCEKKLIESDFAKKIMLNIKKGYEKVRKVNYSKKNWIVLSKGVHRDIIECNNDIASILEYISNEEHKIRSNEAPPQTDETSGIGD